jgi:hypothetical protein
MDELERSTPTKRILLAAVTFLLLSGPLSAHANIIYNWTGACQLGCTGQAHMEIVLPDTFVPGTTLLPVPGPPPVSPRSVSSTRITTSRLICSRFLQNPSPSCCYRSRAGQDL